MISNRTLLIVLAMCSGFLSACSVIEEVLKEEPPIIKVFEATPTQAVAPSEVLFSWEVIDRDSDKLTCTLEFGDGKTSKVENCSQVTNSFHTFAKAGNYVVKLSVTDGRDPVSSTVPVVMDETSTPEEPDTPDSLSIEAFVAQPETGTAPLLSIFRWVLSPTENPVTCTLDFGDGKSETLENCQDITDTFHSFEEAGGYRVVLEASDVTTKVQKSLIVVVNEP